MYGCATSAQVMQVRFARAVHLCLNQSTPLVFYRERCWPNRSRSVSSAQSRKVCTRTNSSTAVGETEIDLVVTHGELVKIEETIAATKAKHNVFLKELGLSPLP